jgi:plastocyanin
LRAAADSLILVLAQGEPSKVPFYVAGAVLAAWAVVLSVFGLRQPGFPGTPARTRAVIGVSALLVLATVTTAITTASKPEGEHGEAQASAGHEAAPAQQETAAPAQQETAPAQQGTAPAAERKPAPAGATVRISADPTGQLKFQQTSVTAKAGRVTIDFDNPSPVPHDVTVTDGKGDLGGTKVITNAKASATIPLKAGSYTFYCSVDAHRQAGMEGKLTVS